MNNRNFTIYLVKNEIDDKVYVGATTLTVKKRQLDHELKSDQSARTKFHKAISTYGIEAFQWKQIDTANSIDELALKEKEYILTYNSKNEGYNSDSGGGFKKSIYQYCQNDGSLISMFNCLETASASVGANKKQISRACLSVNNFFRGFLWSYNYEEPFKPKDDSRKKAVIQLSLDGDEIAKFNSIAEAFLDTGINKSSIAKVCRSERKTAGGFKWSYQ